MKKISIFNNKGGVSKTTSTFHLGWSMANQGKKVLLVDGDPQCNLTELFLGNGFDSYYTNPVTKENNLKDGSAAPFKGQLTQITAIDCVQSQRQHNLYLLPGSLELSDFERQLNIAMTVPTALQSMSGLPGAMNALIDAVAQKYGIDYVLIDLNPGINSTNQIMLACSDGFIIPTNPDTFCIMAIRMLSRVLPQWIDWKNTNLAIYANASYPLPVSTPKFIGTIIQRFNIRNGNPVRAHQSNIDDINSAVRSELIPALLAKGMLFQDSDYTTAALLPNYTLAQISEFNSLGAKSHQFNVPVFELTPDELEVTGIVLHNTQESQNSFRDIYDQATTSIMTLLP